MRDRGTAIVMDEYCQPVVEKNLSDALKLGSQKIRRDIRVKFPHKAHTLLQPYESHHRL